MKYHIFTLILMISSLAQATDIPKASVFDQRIQHVSYNKDDVVLIRAVKGVAFRVVLAEDEKIIDVASGFTEGWEFSDRDNILYIKAKPVESSNTKDTILPVAGKWDTNIMIKSDRRLYDIDLRLVPFLKEEHPSEHRWIAYRVEFNYPEDEEEARREVARKIIAEDEDRRRQARMDADPVPRNWDYSMQIGTNSSGIAPSMAFDDGRFVYLKFPNNRDFPAVFIVGSDNGESLVNSHINPNHPDILVVQRMSEKMVLRLGSSVVAVFNDSFDIDGLAPRNGTTLHNVERVTKGGSL